MPLVIPSPKLLSGSPPERRMAHEAMVRAAGERLSKVGRVEEFFDAVGDLGAEIEQAGYMVSWLDDDGEAYAAVAYEAAGSALTASYNWGPQGVSVSILLSGPLGRTMLVMGDDGVFECPVR